MAQRHPRPDTLPLPLEWGPGTVATLEKASPEFRRATSRGRRLGPQHGDSTAPSAYAVCANPRFTTAGIGSRRSRYEKRTSDGEYAIVQRRYLLVNQRNDPYNNRGYLLITGRSHEREMSNAPEPQISFGSGRKVQGRQAARGGLVAQNTV